jgi:DNA-binding Xre family transcriptional regulator
MQIISYKKAFQLLRKKNVSSYRLLKDKAIMAASLQRMRRGTSTTCRGVDGKTIDSLCKYLNCQPGDLMEYIPDTEDTAGAPHS